MVKEAKRIKEIKIILSKLNLQEELRMILKSLMLASVLIIIQSCSAILTDSFCLWGDTKLVTEKEFENLSENSQVKILHYQAKFNEQCR